MKSLVKLSLPLLLLSGTAGAQEPSGPRGSSQVTVGEDRYDEVGLAGIGPAAGMTIRSAVLKPGEIAEVTVLDSGRTVVVRVTPGTPPPGEIVQLSTVAADALGVVGDRSGVRVRRTVASPIDEARLNAGQSGEARPDAPEVLLVPLRRKLDVGRAPAPRKSAPVTAPVRQVVTPPAAVVPKPRPVTPPPKTVLLQGDYVVRVGAFADIARARAVATKLGGRIVPVGRLHRVQLGPFADTASADRARTRAVSAGFPDARRTLATAP